MKKIRIIQVRVDNTFGFSIQRKFMFWWVNAEGIIYDSIQAAKSNLWKFDGTPQFKKEVWNNESTISFGTSYDPKEK